MINKLISLIMLFGFASSALANKYTTVIIDPGHGGKDRGAKWGGVSEAYLNLKVAKKVETLLKAKNIPVRMTRRSDVFLSLSQRTTMANKYKNAIFVSIHFNAHTNTTIKGVETFYASAKGKIIAANIQSKVAHYTKTMNRGIKSGLKFVVLNKTKCPAVLVECGFISNPYERRRCAQSWYQALAARGIVEGIIKSR
jgi:N-acetylmuramoyl-L-alanine amidase